MQLMNSGDPDTTEIRYMEVIYRKTARLFEAGAQIAAIVARASAKVESALARYGKHLGIAFQLIDDALDYRGDPESLGKNIGDDLAEGKPTLPLIHALRHANGREAEMIRRAIEQGGTEEQGSIRAVVESTGGLDYTAELAGHEIKKALAALADVPASPYRDALAALARFAATRDA
jgi:octaprenyl-diphosphate synthase